MWLTQDPSRVEGVSMHDEALSKHVISTYRNDIASTAEGGTAAAAVAAPVIFFVLIVTILATLHQRIIEIVVDIAILHI